MGTSCKDTIRKLVTRVKRCSMPPFFTVIGFILILSFCCAIVPAWAYREHFTSEQKSQLEKIQTVLIEAIALTDKGRTDSASLASAAAERLKEVGYQVILDHSKPHDVLFRIKCEQHKTWEGTTSEIGRAHV